MNNFDGFNKTPSTRLAPGKCHHIFIALVLVVLSVAACRPAWGQVIESANIGGVSLSVGGGVSGYYIQYGQLKNLGFNGFIDADNTRRFGVETEARWLEYHSSADVHVETYLGGLRYHFNTGRFEPYVKGLCGLGRFGFPYNYADGSYFVIAPGGGVDYHLNRRWSVRVDGEYQYWPQFTFGPMSSGGLSVGARYHIFRDASDRMNFPR
jgi:opacity protein-like surface antigen